MQPGWWGGLQILARGSSKRQIGRGSTPIFASGASVDEAGAAHPSSHVAQSSTRARRTSANAAGAAHPSTRARHSGIEESGKVSGRWGSLPTARACIPSVIFGADAKHVQPRGVILSAVWGVSSADAMKL